jgi:hypothetical protein
MVALVSAIPELEVRIGSPVIVVGGLAVLCRLGIAYRATSDLDTVHRRGAGDPPQLQVLLASGAEQSGPAGAIVPTPAGMVHIDIIEVTDSELDQLPDDPTDRLAVLSHDWAASSAASVRIRALGPSAVTVAEAVVRVAGPGPLIAMKLQSVMNRLVEKERTDLLDIIRLTLDPVTGPVARAQLRETHSQLRADAVLHARRWFIEQKNRTIRLIRGIPEGADVDDDTIELVAELLLAELTENA